MTTRKQFVEKVKELGCTFEEDEMGDSRCITVDAPKGYVFTIRGCHCLVEPFTHISYSFKSKCYDNLMEDLSYGVELCEDPECDICHPEDE
jgi:hypothetical protein